MPNLSRLVKKIVTNKVILYLFSRYFGYFLQFVTSIIIAVKLEPYYFGIWGFLLLIVNYFHISNFGISNAINILLVQHRADELKTRNFISTAFVAIGVLGGFIAVFAGYYYLFGIPFFEKYEVNYFFYTVCFIAILSHFNVLLMTISRVNNRLFEIAFHQFIIPLLVVIASILASGSRLLHLLLGAYVVGHIISLFVFFKGKNIPLDGRPTVSDAKVIIRKGILLFVYNICFYLIIVSIRTLVSIYYPVEEFGYFSFAYTLANAILLFLQALTFIVFPKIIDRLRADDPQRVSQFLSGIRNSYVPMAFGFVFLALIVFPVFILLVPQYQNALAALQLTALAIVLYTNSFGYGAYLMAKNQDKTIARIAVFCLLLNVCIALILILMVKVVFSYVIVATMFSYFLYAYLCVYYGEKLLHRKVNILDSLRKSFPPRLLFPYVISVVIVVNEANAFLPIPFLLFVILNLGALKGIVHRFIGLLNNPNMIDL